MTHKLILNFEQFISYFFYRRKIEVFSNGKLELWTTNTVKRLPDNSVFSVEGKTFQKNNIYFCQL